MGPYWRSSIPKDGEDERATLPPKSKTQRIPESLQAVFLSSNRGKTVNKPPPNGAASKVFERNWLFQRSGVASSLQKLTGSLGSSNAQNRRSNHQNRFSARRGKATQHSRKTQNTRSDESTMNSSESESKAPVHSVTTPSPSFLSKTIPSPVQRNPQMFLDVMMKARGYSTKQYNVLNTAYNNAPTPLQMASYHANLVDFVRDVDTRRLVALMRCGISQNPCNSHGEGLVHVAARAGKYEVLQAMINQGTTLQVCDNMGRTPLHDACWRAKPCLETVSTIIKNDLTLLRLADARGSLPLKYVRKDQWGVWVDFLYSKRDEYFPRRLVRFDGEESEPILTQMPSFSCPVPDPPRALSAALAELVVARRMTTREVESILDGEDETADLTESFTIGSTDMSKSSLANNWSFKIESQDGGGHSLYSDSDDDDSDDDSDGDLSVLEEDLKGNLLCI